MPRRTNIARDCKLPGDRKRYTFEEAIIAASNRAALNPKRVVPVYRYGSFKPVAVISEGGLTVELR